MDDEYFMREALREAACAAAENEVPVGGIVVCRGKIIARAHNLTETLHDATAHAEILAIRRASELLGSWRLTDCTLYVTLEPCVMCAAAIAQARPDMVVFGAFDSQQGGCGSVYAILSDAKLRGKTPVLGGVLREECEAVLKDFFEKRRKG